MDLSDVIVDLADQTITITRFGAGAFVNGIAQAPSSSTFTCAASVQPANGRDLLRLEEGFRTRDVRALFVTTELRAADVAAGTAADQVELADGTVFEVQHVEPWAMGAFWRAVVLRIGQ